VLRIAHRDGVYCSSHSTTEPNQLVNMYGQGGGREQPSRDARKLPESPPETDASGGKHILVIVSLIFKKSKIAKQINWQFLQA